MVRCDDSPRCPRSSAFCHICLQLAVSPTCCIHVLRGRPGGLRQLVPGQRPAFVATTCSSALCAGVVASGLTTWPNSVWRRLVITSPMFGRPVISAVSVLCMVLYCDHGSSLMSSLRSFCFLNNYKSVFMIDSSLFCCSFQRSYARDHFVAKTTKVIRWSAHEQVITMHHF